ncbi:MAG: MbtH family NRPS accessory protein [Deltaproteobacteria bacterium]|nr:MbtH family NRPS accessory protein [Deltaproteobacteria bacterium]
MSADSSGSDRYQVVINHEEQYSIWFADREPPSGWRPTRFKGSRRVCLDHIDQVWTDMRPLDLRERAQELVRRRG